MSCRKACTIMKLSRSVYHYREVDTKDQQVTEELTRLAGLNPGYGFWKMHDRLRLEGYKWNHKRVYRVYRLLHLNIRRKHKKRLPSRQAVAMSTPERPLQMWSMDFMSDSLYNGRRVRVLNIIDDYNRQALRMEVGYSITAYRIIQILEQLVETYGKPMCVRTDNGPEFISHTLMDWCHKKRIQMHFIQPGKPMQNCFIERFNGSFRKEILDAYVFYSLEDLRLRTHQWMNDYNYYRPHDALNGLTPFLYLNRNIKHENLNQITNFELVL